MRCPSCGGDSLSPSGRCSACGSTVAPSAAATVISQSGSYTTGSMDPSDSNATTGLGAGVTRGSGRMAGPLVAGQAFGPRYHIIRVLGAGGMGVVYQAFDDELGVAVALKVIRPEVLEDPGS